MRNITQRQPSLLGQLREIDPNLNIQWDEIRGVASSIRGNLTTAPAVAPTNLRAVAEPNSLAFLETYGELLGPPDISRSLRLLRSRTDDLGWVHLEFQQYYYPNGEQPALRELIQDNAIEVYGSKLAAHFLLDGILREIQSSCWRDIQLDNQIQIGIEELREILTQAVAKAPGSRELQSRLREQGAENFPIMQTPRLVLYPWQGKFLLAWTTYGYGVIDVEDPAGNKTGDQRIELGHIFVDASTGEQFIFAPTRKYQGIETPDTGSGLGVTPLGGPYVSRSLNIVRVDASSTYRLKDTTHDRNIIAYDADANSSWSYPYIYDPLDDGTIPISEDTEGDKTWDRLPANTTDTERRSSQQPEVDAFFFCREAYEWYNALAGSRDGWDNGQYPDPPVPPQLPVRVLTHVYDADSGTSRSVNAFSDFGFTKNGKVIAYLAFFDGDATATCSNPNDSAFDYLAGSKAVVGHEYQHSITDFSFQDGAGNPGLMYVSNTWYAAVHEGLSDVFGCLFAENWFPGLDISSVGLAVRNLAFPRDPNTWANRPYKNNNIACGLSNHNKDHFDDRNLSSFQYDRGTILAHCAYLIGQGGVHQRGSRTPVLIPVYSIGRETINGKDILKAARIWYRSLTVYFSNIGGATGLPGNDENTFRTLRNGCVSAAEDIYGVDSLEHKTTILAFYAVGLHPVGTTYGADVTFLRWGASWWMSRPYIGISSPDWSSVDLFINNGGASEWNALINIIDSTGNPTQYENTVYCRVRNVGDQAAQNVQVKFYYAKVGTPSGWLEVTDKDGNIQVLNIGTLVAGESNFPDSAQNSPPASASVKWYIPPLAAGETVDHFCLKAVVTSDNDVNIYNNEVQSNIAYAPYTPGTPFRLPFIVTNPLDEEIALELKVQGPLPRRWKARILGDTQGIRLKPREERLLNLTIDMPPGEDQQLEPPFDGEVRGKVFGSLSGPFAGTLTDITWDGQRLKGRLVGTLDEIGSFIGSFEGTLDVKTWQIKGRVTGNFQCAGTGNTSQPCLGLEACLRPLRRIDISQLVNGQPINGTTVQVQVPIPDNPYAWKLPPTNTYVVPEAAGCKNRSLLFLAVAIAILLFLLMWLYVTQQPVELIP
ncbi:MAG: bacillolysin [Microcystis flos-aquae TF09]|uniref:Bacillolysin n=1 Tax=Microcystis flos-aquae TF09 TaxID=2060473 RepID=A0A3E0L7I3_9CHRO|nr:MAG: bacillolysin [Microcystis flos-aquae TF09]